MQCNLDVITSYIAQDIYITYIYISDVGVQW